MRIFLFLFLVCILFIGSLFADEIHLNDGSVIKGKILQVTEKKIEYDPDGDRPFGMFPTDQVTKIVYDDGKVIQISFKDEIYLKNGSILKCKINKVTADKIYYFIAGSEEIDSNPRESVIKIIYGDGEVVQLSEDKILPSNGEFPKEVVEQPSIPSGGFHDSILRIGVIGAGGILRHWGELADKEEQLFNNNRSGIPISALYKDDIYSYGIYRGFEIDLTLSSIKFYQHRGFDFTGVIFGIKGRYVYTKIEQELRIYENEEDDIYNASGQLLKYKHWEAGPVVNLIVSPRSNKYNMIIHSYLLLGYISHGELTAVPALRNTQFFFGNTKDDYYTKCDGYSISFGSGPHFVLNQWIPVTIGFNIKYTYTVLNLDKAINLYGSDKAVTFNSVDLELAFGLHL